MQNMAIKKSFYKIDIALLFKQLIIIMLNYKYALGSNGGIDFNPLTIFDTNSWMYHMFF